MYYLGDKSIPSTFALFFQCDDEALRDTWLKTITDQIKELRDIGLRLENPSQF